MNRNLFNENILKKDNLSIDDLIDMLDEMYNDCTEAAYEIIDKNEKKAIYYMGEANMCYMALQCLYIIKENKNGRNNK